METVNEIFTTKQYGNKQIRFPVDDLPKYEIETDANLFSATSPGPSQAGNYENESNDLILFGNQNNDAFRKRMFSPTMNGNGGYGGEILEISSTKCQYISPPRKKRRRRNNIEEFVANYSAAHNIRTETLEIPVEVLGEIYDKATSSESLQQGVDARVDEVMKAAKSLFSKRTRTLYHWMHPNAPKQQIKAAVSASWDSLGVQEKQFYISQVLGRFGFPQCNLMINPQLGGIRELPPVPDIAEFNDISANELRNAISSITIDGNNVFIAENANEYGAVDTVGPMGRRKRLGRPPGSKNKKRLAGDLRGVISHDFQDDPELNQELQQFAMNLNIP
ncbi:uncharacterized protein LOC123315340 isoform X2 [Coccinella septempunctata]|uniref:uncharacterized protein LOC123315340 isoform X2 n=1 Tax=Coccinella septempunctata TaxID=41139 RepID=UPI001D06C1D1|nr:uncharacterized protein LOC123315340 isoform X2 [Coccinella septempunctata]